MYLEKRKPEGQDVDESVIDVFARVSGFGGRMAAGRIARIIGNNFRPGTRILDIGTGPGIIPLELERRFTGIRPAGLDVSVAMLDKATWNRSRLKSTLDLVAGDGQALPFHSSTFDVVTSLFSVHHMERPEALLKEVDRVLKPEGTLLIIDFRRDIAGWLFNLMDIMWQAVFYFSAGRHGLGDSIRSAWTPDELRYRLHQQRIQRFSVFANPVEMFVMKKT